MSEEESREVTYYPRARRRRLVQAFWGFFVFGGAAVTLLPLWMMRVLPAPTDETIFVVWAVIVPVYFIGAAIAVWRAGRNAGRTGRVGSRIAVLATFLAGPVVLVLTSISASGPGGQAGHDKIREAMDAAAPAMEALSRSCAQGGLRPGMGNEALGLDTPGSYAGTYHQAVLANVEDARSAQVVIVMKRVTVPGLVGEKQLAEQGDTIILRGSCSPPSMTWSTAGSVDRGLLPDT